MLNVWELKKVILKGTLLPKGVYSTVLECGKPERKKTEGWREVVAEAAEVYFIW